MAVLNEDVFRKKVLGCWMGKNIGGTLGTPFEWKRQINDISFYTHKLDGNPLPNDDLDIQLLWLIALEERGIDVNAQRLAEYWSLFVTPYWAEYGIAKINLKSGLIPPLSGSFQNPYKHSCGAYIRSEIWACIAPGHPETAANYAYEDAIIDHGDGEGMYAALFCAAIESAAFVESDIRKLIDIGLSYIPADCAVAKACRDMIKLHEEGKTWLEAREYLLTHYRGHYAVYAGISDEERAKGFADGPLGWDVPSNIGIILIGLLYGEGDFGKSLTVSVNCGEDTDCTAGTIGSIFGIIHGIDGIPEEWIKPIGRSIKTACLNLGELGFYGNQLPANVDDLTERTVRIARQVGLARQLPVTVEAGRDTNLGDLDKESLFASDQGASIHGRADGPVHRFDFYDIAVKAGAEGPVIRKGESKRITLSIRNRYKFPEMLTVRCLGDEGLRVSPAASVKVFVHHVVRDAAEVVFELTEEHVRPINRYVFEVTAEGRSLSMLVPVILLGSDGYASNWKPEVSKV